jgi:hypothetical protein
VSTPPGALILFDPVVARANQFGFTVTYKFVTLVQIIKAPIELLTRRVGTPVVNCGTRYGRIYALIYAQNASQIADKSTSALKVQSCNVDMVTRLTRQSLNPDFQLQFLDFELLQLLLPSQLFNFKLLLRNVGACEKDCQF